MGDLDYVKNLESVGLSRDKAEAHVRVTDKMMRDNMASKQDLQALDISIRESIYATELRLNKRVDNLDKKLDKKFLQLGDLLEARIENKIWQKIAFSALGAALLGQALGYILNHYG